jgi:phosphotransferase system HPr (HPr) family protein
MIERTVVIRNRLGLHARPAADFVKTASRFLSDITLGKDGSWVNGKSIMGVMTLAAECGSEVTVRADGSDAEQAVEDLVACLMKEYVEQ